MKREIDIMKDCSELNCEVQSSSEVMEKIAAMAVKNPVLARYSASDILHRLSEREKLFSTGIGNNIALPHCALPGIDEFVIGILTIKDNGIDFSAIDKKPVRLFIYIISPENKKNDHISCLTNISRMLKDRNTYEQIINARSPDDLQSIFTSYNSLLRFNQGGEPEKSTSYSRFTVIVQDQSKLEEVLQLLFEIHGSFITILEGNYPGNYLQTIPLFASLWNKNDREYCKVILTYVPQKLSNELIRRLNTIDTNEYKIFYSMSREEYSSGQIDI